jgi:hypothetical protein
MMRLKPISLAAVLAIALCGATQPADGPSEAAEASSSEVIPASEPGASPAPESPGAAPSEAALSDAVPSDAVPSDAAPANAVTSDAAPADAAPAEEMPDAEADTAGPAGEAAPPSDTAAPPPSAEAVVPAEKPAVPAKGKPPTREYFVGVWAEEGQSCETALDFKADGTLIGPFPRWELSDTGELTMVGNRQKVFLTVIDANTVQARRAPNVPPRTLKRCGG